MAKAINTGNVKPSAPSAVKTEKAAKVPKEKKAQLPFGKKFSTVAKKAGQRVGKSLKAVLAIPSGMNVAVDAIQEKLTSAMHALDLAQLELAALPDTFAPNVKASKSGGSIAVGTVVAIRAKRLPEYEGLLSDADLASLTVINVKGTKLALKTAGGNTLLMPKAHVEAKAA